MVSGLWGSAPAPAAPPPSGRPMSMGVGLLRTARPKQWVKNVLLFAAPGAAGVLTQAGALGRTLLAFGLFCVVASGTYFLNDSIDAEADRRHPTKRERPIAAGVIPVPAGMAIGVGLLVTSIAGSALITWRLSVVFGVYVCVQLAYSFALKHQPVYDLACVAAGFVLRAIAGGVAAEVPISQWFLIVATFGSLLMVTGKRLAEQIELGEDSGAHRATLEKYTPTFLRTVLAISATGAIVGYCLWAFALTTALRHHADPLWYQVSIVPMLIALLRYTFLVERGQGAKPEDLVLSDRSLLVLGAIWLAVFSLGIYAS